MSKATHSRRLLFTNGYKMRKSDSSTTLFLLYSLAPPKTKKIFVLVNECQKSKGLVEAYQILSSIKKLHIYTFTLFSYKNCLLLDDNLCIKGMLEPAKLSRLNLFYHVKVTPLQNFWVVSSKKLQRGEENCNFFSQSKITLWPTRLDKNHRW